MKQSDLHSLNPKKEDQDEDQERSGRTNEPTEACPPSFYEEDLARYLHKFKHAIKDRTLLKNRLHNVSYFGD